MTPAKETTKDANDRAITLAGEALRPISRALFWPRAKTLYVADLHIGKAATFRSVGIPVPEAANDHDLAELAELITAVRTKTDLTRLVVLGDLIHARRGRSQELEARVANWFESVRHSAELHAVLVRGNHDRGAGDPPPSWGMTVVPGGTPDHAAGGPNDAPFILRHEPELDDRGPVLAGHTHPAMRFRDFGYRTVRVPCFHLKAEPQSPPSTPPRACLTLPAWTRFSGAHTIRKTDNDRCWPVLEGRVSPSFGART